MTNSLKGKRILVTRPAGQAENLCQLIEKQDGIAVRFPTLEITEARPNPELLAAASQSDWLIFTSTNAVDFAIKAFNGKMAEFKQPRLAAVGQATAQALSNAGYLVNCVPASEFNSEGLLAELAMQQVSGMNCVIVRGIGGRDKLEQGLSQRGAKVTYLEVYQRSQPDNDNKTVIDQLLTGQLDAITITSSESLQNLILMLTDQALPALQNTLLVSASERIAGLAKQLGFKRIAVSQQPTDAAILQTLTTLYNGENSGRRN